MVRLVIDGFPPSTSQEDATALFELGGGGDTPTPAFGPQRVCFYADPNSTRPGVRPRGNKRNKDTGGTRGGDERTEGGLCKATSVRQKLLTFDRLFRPATLC